MAQFTSYCAAVASGEFSALHQHYHATEYGFPVSDDNALFGRLILEINQAGLSWDTVLKKKNSIRNAYAEFSIPHIAAFTESDIQRLLQDKGIIRMRKKIEAIIYNANKVLELQKETGSFANWISMQNIECKEDGVAVFKKYFHFTGNEITNEFLMGTGYIKGAHEPTCPIYKDVLKAKPHWARQSL